MTLRRILLLTVVAVLGAATAASAYSIKNGWRYEGQAYDSAYPKQGEADPLDLTFNVTKDGYVDQVTGYAACRHNTGKHHYRQPLFYQWDSSNPPEQQVRPGHGRTARFKIKVTYTSTSHGKESAPRPATLSVSFQLRKKPLYRHDRGHGWFRLVDKAHNCDSGRLRFGIDTVKPISKF